MIVDGRIALLQYDAIDRFMPQGVRLKDGTVQPLDLVVAATGYETQQHFVRTTLGDAVADRIGPVWGFDDQGELRNMWTPTAQPGLWFTAGSLAQCRIFSRYLALQIKAREEGRLIVEARSLGCARDDGRASAKERGAGRPRLRRASLRLQQCREVACPRIAGRADDRAVDTHAARAGAIGCRIVADRQHRAGIDAEPGQDGAVHRRRWLADLAMTQAGQAGAQRRQQRAGLRHRLAVGAGMAGIAVGHDQACAARELANGAIERSVVEALVTGQQHDVRSFGIRHQPRRLGQRLDRVAAIDPDARPRPGRGGLLDRGVAGQDDAVRRHRQAERGQPRRQRLRRVGRVVRDDPQPLAGMGRQRARTGQQSLAGDQATVEVAQQRAIAVEPHQPARSVSRRQALSRPAHPAPPCRAASRPARHTGTAAGG
ncbi:conserved hypothetical protein [Ricinus communis]|uniref:Uncharacterized protein n=1 Tax=Ricinus communis TaxID=3988 RepID=B9TGH1_RICCO|nr:conserved hypothetical protein [Ricinus communis]